MREIVDFEAPTSNRESPTSATPTPAQTSVSFGAADESPKRKARAPKPKTIPWDRERGFLELGREPETLPSSRMQKYEAEFFPGETMTTDNQSGSTALDTKPETALAAYRPSGFEDFQKRDLIVPDLKVGQGNSRVTDAEVTGKLYNSIDHTERHDKIRVVFIAFRHGQVMFPKKDGKPDFESPATCRSSDGRVPSPSIEKPIAEKCRDEFGEPLCPAAKWTEGNTKPACAETYNLVVVDINTGMPYRFSLKGESVTTARRLLSALKFRATRNQRALYDFEADISLTKEMGREGAYYVPIFGNITMVDAGKYKSLFEEFARAKGADDVEEKAADVGGTVADAAAKGEAEKKTKPKSKGGKELDFDT